MKNGDLKIKIAIADDQHMVRCGILGMLEQSDIAEVIEEFNSATSLMKNVQNAHWDILLLDIDLKDGNGVELTSQILSYRPDIKVIILSALPAKTYGILALKAGAMGYISKDISPNELNDAIEAVASGNKYLNVEMIDCLVRYAIRPSSGGELHEKLSIRELQVLELLADGKANSDIAEILHISPKSVSTYRSRLLKKLGLKSTSELISYVFEHNLHAKGSQIINLPL